MTRIGPGGHRASTLLWSSAVLAILSAPPLHAQVRVAGRVFEDISLQPIAAARITFFDVNERFLGAVTTDQDGSFTFVVEKAPAVRMQVRRIGYAQTTTPLLRFDDHNFFEVEIRLRTDAVLIAPLEVTAIGGRGNPIFSGFEHRRKVGAGIYFTRADIEQRKPALVTDLIATVPGVHLSGSGTGSRRTISIGRANCPAQLYVDGFLVNVAGAFALDEVVSPADVQGIEVYRGLGTVPPEFHSPQARCGVIVVWTRR